MNISSISSTAIAPPVPTASRPAVPAVREDSKSYSGFGSLSQQQLDTLRAAVGYDFNWPPSPDSGTFPLAAVFVANHIDFSNVFTLQQPLTAESLKALAGAGLLSAADVGRGIAFLRGEQAGDNNQVPRPVVGTVAADGSMYL